MDCMDGMKEFPDGFFDLAIVDPPYGTGNRGGTTTHNRFGGRFDRYEEIRPVQQQRQAEKIYNYAGGGTTFPNRRNMGSKIR